MKLYDLLGKELPVNNNVHLLYPWGANSYTVALQVGTPLAKQLQKWKEQQPGNSLIGYIIIRDDDIHINIDAKYEYNFIQRNPRLSNNNK